MVRKLADAQHAAREFFLVVRAVGYELGVERLCVSVVVICCLSLSAAAPKKQRTIAADADSRYQLTSTFSFQRFLFKIFHT